MLKYLNGKIVKDAIPNETVLLIKLDRNNTDQAKPLSTDFQEIIKEYKKYISAICFIGGEEDHIELAELAKETKKNGLKVCLSTFLQEESQINLKLLNELDYLQLKTKMFKKDYSPFGDAEVWIDVL